MSSIESEQDALITTYRDRPRASAVAFELMQPCAGEVHVIDLRSVMLSEKNILETLRVLWPDSFPIAVGEETL